MRFFLSKFWRDLISNVKDEGYYPKSLAFQQGSKRMSPDELTQVSDSGERVPLTPLQRQGRRVN
ncbi:addiction module toxin RelE [Yersinia mollaretii]|nr:addiction module toxin RelE [Yersinia mollaretii]